MSALPFAARHSMDSDSWYTPSPFVEAAREVMGGIDLDPASHEEANLTVKAVRFFTEETNGLIQPWRGRVFINPPGGKDDNGSLVPQFWLKLLKEFGRTFDKTDLDSHVSQAIWIGYSLEQLQTLQGTLGRSPLNFPMCVPRKRIPFIENEAKRIERLANIDAQNAIRREEGKPLKRRSEKADGPSHANYITYLGPNSGAFERVFKQFGQVR